MRRVLLLSFAFLLMQFVSSRKRKLLGRQAPAQIEASVLRDEVTDFLTKEVAAHLSDIKSYDPAPARVFNAGATGEYTWGTFMNAVGAYAALSGKQSLAGRDLAREAARSAAGIPARRHALLADVGSRPASLRQRPKHKPGLAGAH